MSDVGPAPLPAVSGPLVAGPSRAGASSILREGMRTHPLGYAHFPLRPFFSSTPLACGFGRRTSKRGVHTRYAHCAYPSGGARERQQSSTQNRGGAPLRRPASSVLWNHPCRCVVCRTASDSMSGPAPQLLSTTQTDKRIGDVGECARPKLQGLGRAEGGSKPCYQITVHWTRLLCRSLCG